MIIVRPYCKYILTYNLNINLVNDNYILKSPVLKTYEVVPDL